MCFLLYPPLPLPLQLELKLPLALSKLSLEGERAGKEGLGMPLDDLR